MIIPEDAIQIVEHTADWAVRVRGRDLIELFRHAALGMARLLAGDVSALALESHDVEGLLVEWLGELAYWAERDGLVFPVVEFDELTPTTLRGAAHGGPAALQKHIKAVTYHDLAIRPHDNGLEVTIVFDV